MLAKLIVATLFFSLALGASVPKPHKLRPDGRIIGGDKATIEDNPWQVSLQILGSHFCGGSIIAEDVILTAAHCVDLLVSFDTVVAGTADLSVNGVSVGVDSAIVHEDYNDLSYDVAIIKLKTKLELNDQIAAVTLGEQEPDVGAEVKVSGWGILNEGDIFTPSQLYSVNVTIIDREICNQDYSSYDVEVDGTMICAGVENGGKDACSGDSGGPLTKDGVQYGIVSWGVGCALADFPGVYTNVASVREWIRTNAGV